MLSVSSAPATNQFVGKCGQMLQFNFEEHWIHEQSRVSVRLCSLFAEYTSKPFQLKTFLKTLQLSDNRALASYGKTLCVLLDWVHSKADRPCVKQSLFPHFSARFGNITLTPLVHFWHRSSTDPSSTRSVCHLPVPPLGCSHQSTMVWPLVYLYSIARVGKPLDYVALRTVQ